MRGLGSKSSPPGGAAPTRMGSSALARGREQLQQEAGEAAPAAKSRKQQEAAGGPRKRSGWRGRQPDRRRRRRRRRRRKWPPKNAAPAAGVALARGVGWDGCYGAKVLPERQWASLCRREGPAGWGPVRSGPRVACGPLGVITEARGSARAARPELTSKPVLCAFTFPGARTSGEQCDGHGVVPAARGRQGGVRLRVLSASGGSWEHTVVVRCENTSKPVLWE